MLRHSAIAVLTVAVLGGAWSAAADALPVTAVAPGVFVHAGLMAQADPGNQGDIANIGFVVGTEAVAVIDTGGSVAVGRRLRQAVRQHTDLPIRYVVNTHMHPDHVFGNAAFIEDRPVFVAHAGMAPALMARADAYLAIADRDLGGAAADIRLLPPDLTVGDRHEIELGGRTLELVAHPPAHTSNDLTVLDRGTGTLWAGDLVFVDRLPVVDGSLTGWLALIDRLGGVPAARVVPGHGPASAPWPAALAAQRRYLERLRDDIRAVQDRGGTIGDAVRSVAADERGRWLLFEDDHPRNVTAAFAELEWE